MTQESVDGELIGSGRHVDPSVSNGGFYKPDISVGGQAIAA